MRLRPLVTLTAALLLLGACGVSAKSAAPKNTTTTSQSTSSTPVTDLNGHQIVGVKARDVAAEAVPDKPLDRATRGSFPDPQKVRSTFCGDSRAPAPLVLVKQSGRRSFWCPLPPSRCSQIRGERYP